MVNKALIKKHTKPLHAKHLGNRLSQRHTSTHTVFVCLFSFKCSFFEVKTGKKPLNFRLLLKKAHLLRFYGKAAGKAV